MKAFIYSVIAVLVFMSIVLSIDYKMYKALNSFVGYPVKILWSKDNNKNLVEWIQDDKTCSAIVHGSRVENMSFKTAPYCQ